MNNADLYRQWVGRYAERIAKPLPSGGANPTPPNPAGQPDPNAGTPLVVPASSIPYVSEFFLSGKFGKEFLGEYNKVVKREYGNANALRVLNWDDGEDLVVGSNPFAIAVANQILQKKDIRTATQSELEAILKGNKLPFRDHYEESSLVWRSHETPNDYLALDLYNQFKAKGINLVKGKAYVLPLYALGLRKDNNSPNKLSFVLSETPVYFEAPILNEPSQQLFKNSDIYAQTGLPTKVQSSGDRKIYTRNWHEYAVKNSGLSRLCLGRYLYVYSYGGGLANSNEDGRVVCISGAAARPQKF